MKRSQLVVAALLTLICGAGPLHAQSAPQAFVNLYCSSCHNERTKSGNLTLTGLTVAENLEIWEKVVKKLRGRIMPPAGQTRPDERTYDSIIANIEKSLDATAAANPDPGRTETFRRLNRTEYQNAIRDLLSLNVDVSSLLPKDDASFGFDNVGAGSLSPTLLERYLAAAQKISHLAVGTPVRTPAASVLVLPADLTQEGHMEGLPLGTRGGTVMNYTFPSDACTRFRFA
jgi:uncharacterized protein DUF1587